MTPETFLEKFDQLAEAPSAGAKMRELVVHLAVRGKLVDQRRDDGDAGQLLASISSERDKRAAKLRTPQKPALPDRTGYPFQIPPNWAWTQLGNVALQIQYGYTASADPSATEIRMLRITDIQNSQVDWPTVPGCQIEQGEAERYLLSQNDILIARTGGTIGKSFIVPQAPVKSVFASYLIRVTPPRSMEARYLKIFLESPLYWMQLREMSAGTGQPNVNGQALGRLELPLPPLAEQKRIAAKVDELMALCDQLEAQQQERETKHAALARASLARFDDAPTPANLNFLFHKSYAISPADLRTSILALAERGHLVAQHGDEVWPALRSYELGKEVGESAEEAGSSMERAERSFAIPGRWKWLQLGDLQPDFQNGVSSRGDKDGSPVIVLRLADVREQRICLDDPRKIPIDDHQQSKFGLRNGDVLITRVNGSAEIVGTFIPVETDLEAIYCDHFIRMRVDQSLMYPGYLALLGRTPLVRKQIKDLFITTAGQKTVNQGHIRSLLIAVPPPAEQRRIVAKVEELMVLVDQLETQLDACQATAADLLEAVVAELAA